MTQYFQTAKNKNSFFFIPSHPQSKQNH